MLWGWEHFDGFFGLFCFDNKKHLTLVPWVWGQTAGFEPVCGLHSLGLGAGRLHVWNTHDIHTFNTLPPNLLSPGVLHSMLILHCLL